MIRTILVPLDGSPCAEQALPQARRLADSVRATMILVHVTPDGTILVDSTPAYATVADEADEYLRRAQRYLAGDACSPHMTGFTDPAEMILRAASRYAADIIVMSTNGRSGVSRTVLGSIADGVLNAAAIPVLLVRASAHPHIRHEGAYRKILIPLDGTIMAEEVVRYVTCEAFARSDQIVLLRAVLPDHTHRLGAPRSASPTPLRAPSVQTTNQRLATARRYVDAIGHVYLEPGGHRWQAHVTHDDPAEAILQTAVEEEVDIIAMATDWRSGFERLLHGSITMHVLHHAEVPVLLVQGTATTVGDREVWTENYRGGRAVAVTRA